MKKTASEKPVSPVQIDAAYLELVDRLMLLIPRWCSTRECLPVLEFYNPGRIMIARDLSGLGLRLLAKTPDAIALLEWLDEQTGRQATMFQATVALHQLGYLENAEPLSAEKISELVFAWAGVMQVGGQS